MRRFAVVLWMLFCFACFTTVSYGQSLQIANGLSYLHSSQGGDGAWGGGAAPVETTAATVSVVEILKLLEQTYGTSYAKGVSWLQAQTPQSVAYVADRASVLGSAAESVNVLVAAIDRLRGGWGGDDGYATNILDTAAALRALKAASYSDPTLKNAALAFLTTSQNADGGWGFTRGNRSEIYVTATVSATLQQFPQMTTIATAVGRASAYLLAHQNADGSFGSPATPHETALAYIALVGDGQTQGLPLQNAVNFLTTTQSASGSCVNFV